MDHILAAYSCNKKSHHGAKLWPKKNIKNYKTIINLKPQRNTHHIACNYLILIIGIDKIKQISNYENILFLFIHIHNVQTAP